MPSHFGILLALFLAAAAPAAAPAESIDGTWDLYWQTAKGPRQSGYFVFYHSGPQLVAEMHGKGMVKVRGSASGNAFQLSGTRMLVKYRVFGTWAGNQMDGSFKVLNKELKFTARRRVQAKVVPAK